MNKKVIKVHKGVDNEVRFRVLNPDRKPVSIDHLSIRARLINIQNGERVLDKYANATSTKGDVRLKIFEGDLTNVAPGHYNLVITGEESFIPQLSVGENFQNPFYVDRDQNIVAVVEVVGSADPTPVPTIVLGPDNWTVVNDEENPKSFYSSAIPGSRIKNHINATHTFAAYATGFTGTLQVRASLDLQPPADINDYFPVDITTGTDIIEFDNFTGVTSHSFEANFMWLIFIYTADDSLEDYGTLDKVMIR